MEFVEAKCRAGLVFELEEDYRDARTALPEAQTIFREDQRRCELIALWTAEIMSYSRAWSERRDWIGRGERLDETEPALPTSPAFRMWTDEEIEGECRRIREAPSRFDRLVAFAGFVQAESNPLLQFGGRAGFSLQHAINYAPGGPVHEAARGLRMQWGAPLLLRRWSAAASWSPKLALLRTLEGHRGEVHSVSMTPDGRLAVSGSSDKTLRVWDLESGVCLRSLEGHRGWVQSVSITPDGRLAVSGSSDKTLRVWDLESGVCLRSCEGHRDSLFLGVSVTPDGRRAVSAFRGVLWGSDDGVRMWDLESGACLRTLEPSAGCVHVAPDGQLAVSGAGTLQLWDLESGARLRTLYGHNDTVFYSVSVAPDGRRAVSGSAGTLPNPHNTVRMWDLESGACLLRLVL
jgi:hypothetical protein